MNSAADAMSAGAESSKRKRKIAKNEIKTLKKNAQTGAINPIKAGREIGKLGEQITEHRKDIKKQKQAARKLRM